MTENPERILVPCIVCTRHITVDRVGFCVYPMPNICPHCGTATGGGKLVAQETKADYDRAFQSLHTIPR